MMSYDYHNIGTPTNHSGTLTGATFLLTPGGSVRFLTRKPASTVVERSPRPFLGINILNAVVKRTIEKNQQKIMVVGCHTVMRKEETR